MRRTFLWGLLLAGGLMGLASARAQAATKGDPSQIRWLEDDWTKAEHTAKRAGKLVAVDVWATWCHTCLSMKNYVLTNRALRTVASKHTWLALDYDKEKNAAFFEKFPVNAFPTFLVIDPARATVVARWVGSGTAEQMAAFFAAAERNSSDALASGHVAIVEKDYAKARSIFEHALEREDLDRAMRSRLLSGWLEALWKLDEKTCAEEGVRHLGETDDSAVGLDFASMVFYCSEALPKPERRRIGEAVRDRLAPIADRADLPVSVDDRSGLWGTLTEIYDFLEDEKNAERAVVARLKLLEEAAASASTKAQRATFDPHRLELYLRLGRFAEAEKMLLASEKDQPKDFNHPWRLAMLHLKSKNFDRGLAAIDRALANGYGARKLRLYSTKLDLLLEKRDHRTAAKVLAEAEAELKRLPKAQVRDYWVQELKAKGDRVDAASKGP